MYIEFKGENPELEMRTFMTLAHEFLEKRNFLYMQMGIDEHIKRGVDVKGMIIGKLFENPKDFAVVFENDEIISWSVKE